MTYATVIASLTLVLIPSAVLVGWLIQDMNTIRGERDNYRARYIETTWQADRLLDDYTAMQARLAEATSTTTKE